MAFGLARCPGCRASLSSPLCPRCGSDFSSVVAARREALRELILGVRRLEKNDPAGALQNLSRARSLDGSLPALRELLALAGRPPRRPVLLRSGGAKGDGLPRWFFRGKGRG
ncbi:MAG: hypothetical protein ACP5OS_08985 [Leptospirillia bacterium]